MADFWFYRPPLKQTTQINFKSLLNNASKSLQRVCSSADAARRDLLSALATDPEKSSPDSCGLIRHLENYLSLLAGGLQQSGSGGLQGSIPASWNDTLGQTKSKVEKKDVAFDYGNILLNAALWHAKRAGYIIRQQAVSPTQNDANMKEAFMLLKTAAGMVAHIKSDISSKLKERAEPFTDMDTKVLECYQNQFLAEAQEIVLKRAIEGKQSADIIGPLAGETALKYGAIAEAMAAGVPSSDSKHISKDLVKRWKLYGECKRAFWQSISRCFQIESLLATEQAPPALKCIEDAQAQEKVFSDIAVKNRRDLGNIPDQAFHALSRLVERTVSKAKQENLLLFKARASPEMPPILSSAQYGITTANPYEMPAASPLWADVLPPNSGSSNNNNTGDSSSNSGSCLLM